MLLQVSVPNDPNVYVSSFMGGAVSLAAMTEPLNATVPATDPTTGRSSRRT